VNRQLKNGAEGGHKLVITNAEGWVGKEISVHELGIVRVVARGKTETERKSPGLMNEGVRSETYSG